MDEEKKEPAPRKPNFRNRRSFCRRGAKGVVMVRQGKWGTSPPSVCQILDINEAGVKLLSAEPMAMNAVVEVELAGLRGRNGKKVEAVVRYLETVEGGFLIGLGFQSRIVSTDFSHLVR